MAIAASVVLLFLFLVLSVPIAAVLGLLGIGLDVIFSGFPLHRAIGEIAWSTSTDFLLIAIPLFVLLGEIMLRAGIATRMYDAVAMWLSWLPGGLMHANIGACTLFAATSGSSVATAATIGTISMPEIDKRGYNERLFLGSLAAGGTLGILIPPSINLVIYGALTNTSVPDLYLAAIIPGFILAFLFILLIAGICTFRPRWGGERIVVDWSARFRALGDLLPPVFIFAVVVGTIYAGWATPTEAAALGVAAALVLAAFYRRLTWAMLRDAAEGTMCTTALLIVIVIAAFFLNFVLASLGITATLTASVSQLDMSPMAALITIILFYIVLGCVMETLSIMIATVPVITPVVIALGFDPVWFGIILVILLETALITPPIGVNLFVVQSVRNRGSANDVALGALPFLLCMLAMIVVLLVFPEIVLSIISR